MSGTKPLILAVDDEVDMLETYQSILGKKFKLVTASAGPQALQIIGEQAITLVLLDVRMPKLSGLEVLKQIKNTEPEIAVIMVTASKDITSAVEAMKLGAADYITKPFEVKELLLIIDNTLEKSALIKENTSLKEQLKETTEYCQLIGQTEVMKKLFSTIEQIAPTESTVLIQGESGTGKELVARAIHDKSRRKNKPFIALNCAAIPENLLESELFGHERGAFTSAMERKLGKFELADGGTLFLDEIGCMSVAMQAKLLRVLESKTIERLGGEKEVPIDVRIISATNIDFKKAIADGKFRHDLYYRLNVLPIDLVPLRQRRADIPLFINFFLNKFNRILNKQVRGFSPETVEAMTAYPWPGNIRELQNLIERLVVLTRGETINANDLPFGKETAPPNQLKELVNSQERELIAKALKDCNDNRTKAAKQLGIPRTSLNSKISALGLS